MPGFDKKGRCGGILHFFNLAAPNKRSQANSGPRNQLRDPALPFIINSEAKTAHNRRPFRPSL